MARYLAWQSSRLEYGADAFSIRTSGGGRALAGPSRQGNVDQSFQKRVAGAVAGLCRHALDNRTVEARERVRVGPWRQFAFTDSAIEAGLEHLH